MKLNNWIKKYFLLLYLLIVVILLTMIKINLKPNEQIKNNVSVINISPIPTIIKKNTPILEKKYGNKTKEEILQMEEGDGYSFVANLSREDIEELDMMSNYNFSDFLPYKGETFIAEKFLYEDKKLFIKPLIIDKEKIKKEIGDWLFYVTGNNPTKIEIIWQ